jgi:hypothetical protein
MMSSDTSDNALPQTTFSQNQQLHRQKMRFRALDVHLLSRARAVS